MEVFTKILINIPIDFDYELNKQIAENKKMGIKRTKADEIIRLARIGLLKEKIDEVLTQYHPGK